MKRKEDKFGLYSQTLLRRFAATIKLPKRKPGKPIILTPAGPSCVGKTTVMKFIQHKLPYFVRIANDDLRLFLKKNGIAGSSVEKIIYKRPSYQIAADFLKKGYAVIIDANLATKPQNIKLLRSAARRFETKFFVLRITAPPAFIKKKLQRKNFLKNGLLLNWKVAWEHFYRSSKEFDYEKLGRWYMATVDTSRPVDLQLAKPLHTLARAMRISRRYSFTAFKRKRK